MLISNFGEKSTEKKLQRKEFPFAAGSVNGKIEMHYRKKNCHSFACQSLTNSLYFPHQIFPNFKNE